MTKAKERAKAIEEEVLQKNGITRDFTNKEVYLLLLDNIDRKLDEHLKWANILVEKYLPVVEEQGQILKHICDELPNKGFCGKVDKMYNDLYPEGTEEPSLPQKVNLLWNDRRWLKGIVYFLVAVGLLDFGLLLKFMLGW